MEHEPAAFSVQTAKYAEMAGHRELGLMFSWEAFSSHGEDISRQYLANRSVSAAALFAGQPNRAVTSEKIMRSS